MREICQSVLPMRPWADARLNRLPGLSPVAPGEWLLVDDAYAGQMAYREELLAARPEAVLRLSERAEAAAREVLDLVIGEMLEKPGFRQGGGAIQCPDGRRVEIDRARPLETAARLTQDDLCLLQKPDAGGEHLLTGAVLCFPASWSLDEKFMQPLTRIHVPVPVYDDEIARRVQRLFDGLQVTRPIWRANHLLYSDPDLHQPRREGETHALPPGSARWLRMERQALRRLPESGAVVFSIHTTVFPLDRLSAADRAALLG